MSVKILCYTNIEEHEEDEIEDFLHYLETHVGIQTAVVTDSGNNFSEGDA